MSKNKKIILIVLISLSLFGLSIYLIEKLTPSNLPLIKGEEKGGGQVILEINNTKYESEISETISVYDFMNKLQEEGKITFKDKTYMGMGKLIEEINGVKSSGDKYWIYSVNGIEAQVGVSDYKINPGDIVSWKYGNGNY